MDLSQMLSTYDRNFCASFLHLRGLCLAPLHQNWDVPIALKWGTAPSASMASRMVSQPVRPSKGHLDEYAWWPTPGNFQVCSSHTNYTVSRKSRHQLEKPQQLYEQAARGVMTWGWREGPRPFHCLIVNRLNDVNWFEKKMREAVLIATKIPLTSSVYCSRWLFTTKNVITSLKN